MLNESRMPHIASFFFLWFFQTSPRRASQIPSLIHAHSYVATSPVGFQSLVSILCSLELISSTPLRLQEQEPIVTLMNSFLLPLFRGFLPLSDVLFHFISTIFFFFFFSFWKCTSKPPSSLSKTLWISDKILPRI